VIATFRPNRWGEDLPTLLAAVSAAEEDGGHTERVHEGIPVSSRQATKSPTRKYLAVVVLTVGAHFGYLVYLPSGGFLALRWPRTILFHVPTVVWGIGVVRLNLPCPLTSLEQWARRRAEMDPLPAGGFIDRYAAGVLYPSDGTGTAQTLAFLAAAVSWVAFASKRLPTTRRPRLPAPATVAR